MSQNLSIYWVRHAESCSNLDMQALDDKIPKDYPKHIGYDILKDLPEKYVEKSYNLEYLRGLVRTVTLHPNPTFIGMQHAILLGNYFRNLEHPIDIVFTSPTIRTIMTALMAFRSQPNLTIYVVPFITEQINIAGTFDATNTPLTSSQISQMIPFIKEWLHTAWINNFDDIEIIGNLISLRDCFQNSPIESTVINSIVSHIDSILDCKPDHYISRKDTQICAAQTTYPECPYLSKLQTLSKLLQAHRMELKCEIKLIDQARPHVTLGYLVNYFKIFEDHASFKAYFEGPQVNLEILKYYESSRESIYPTEHHHDVVPYFNKFYTEILGALREGVNLGLTEPENVHQILSKSNPSICVISHGYSMRTYFHQKYGGELEHSVRNTQVYLETADDISTYDDLAMSPSDLQTIGSYGSSHPNSSINYTAYVPPDIRSTFENFEYLNDDICKVQSLRGVINYALWKKHGKEVTGDKYTCDMVNTYENISYKQKGGTSAYEKYIAAKKLYLRLKSYV